MIVVPRVAPPARRWLAHLVRACEGTVRRADSFDDDFRFDEDAVFELAMRQRVAPLLYRAISDGLIGDSLPSSFRERCERVYYATLRKNVIALEAGRELLRGFERFAIPAAPFKGWALMLEPAPVHLDPGTRPMEDLDLIVRHFDVERAEVVLQDLGFRRVTRRPAALRGGHELAFHRRDAGVDLFLELHWAWSDPKNRAREFGVSGEQFLAGLCEQPDVHSLRPTRTGNLLFAAVHAARHALGRWIWLVDMHRLVAAGPALDWQQVLTAARRWRVRGPLYAGLVATRELVRTPIPREVLDELAPGPLRRRLLHRCLSASMAESASRRAAWTAKLLLGESWWDVARTAAWATRPASTRREARAGAIRRQHNHPLHTLLSPGSRP